MRQPTPVRWQARGPPRGRAQHAGGLRGQGAHHSAQRTGREGAARSRGAAEEAAGEATGEAARPQGRPRGRRGGRRGATGGGRGGAGTTALGVRGGIRSGLGDGLCSMRKQCPCLCAATAFTRRRPLCGDGFGRLRRRLRRRSQRPQAPFGAASATAFGPSRRRSRQPVTAFVWRGSIDLNDVNSFH